MQGMQRRYAPSMWNGFSQAVEPRLTTRNGIHVSPKKASNVLADEDAEMDMEEWKEEEREEDREIAGQKAIYRPSKEEWNAHRRTHIPFRKWYPHCVRGKCKAAVHMRNQKTEAEIEQEVPEISLDYMGKKLQDEKSKKIE